MDSKQLLLNLIKFNYVSAYMHYSVCTLIDAFIQVHFARFKAHYYYYYYYDCTPLLLL